MAVDDSYTKALLHMDGSDASTTITDESGKTWTAAGNAQLDTAQKEFGTASLLLDGTTDKITTSDSDDFNFGTGDFTIDFWFRPGATVVQYDTFLGQFVDANNLWKLDTATNVSTYGLRFTCTSGGSVVCDYVSGDLTYTVGTWYHIAVVRNGTSLLIFKDGTSVSLTVNNAISTDAMPNLAADLTVGLDAINAGRDINGHIDELRISKGIARWTSNFTPPTSAYGPAGSTPVNFLSLLGCGT
jgi:hypothetical protein